VDYKILVVDDEESIRILYAEELTREGYEVITTGDRSEILQLIEKETPRLLILDIGFDNENALDLLQDIQNRFDFLPVILCSAYPSFKNEMKSSAADDFFVKSSNLEELKRKIEKF
jgi:DNA-binding NtrC family response regulator